MTRQNEVINCTQLDEIGNYVFNQNVAAAIAVSAIQPKELHHLCKGQEICMDGGNDFIHSRETFGMILPVTNISEAADAYSKGGL